MKRLLAGLLAAALLLTGCARVPAGTAKKQFTATFLTLFDTVTTIRGCAADEEDFRATAQTIHD